MDLSKNFTLGEFLRSEVASRMGRKIEAPEDIRGNLSYLVTEVLQPLRDKINRPFVITSGYRPYWLNNMIGGSHTSAHLYGCASDTHVIGMSNYAFAKLVADNIELYPIDQLIYEFGDWVHIAVPRPGVKPRRQILTAVHNPETGKTVYLPGLVQQEEN